VQETATIGMTVSNYVHEGNGDLWLDALASPRRHVRWVLIEEGWICCVGVETDHPEG